MGQGLRTLADVEGLEAGAGPPDGLETPVPDPDAPPQGQLRRGTGGAVPMRVGSEIRDWWAGMGRRLSNRQVCENSGAWRAEHRSSGETTGAVPSAPHRQPGSWCCPLRCRKLFRPYGAQEVAPDGE